MVNAFKSRDIQKYRRLDMLRYLSRIWIIIGVFKICCIVGLLV